MNASNNDILKDLKSAWQSQKQRTDFSKEQIFKMLQRKSLTSVKWIFIISLIELLLGIGVILFTVFSAEQRENHIALYESLGTLGIFYECLNVFYMIGVVVFVVYFFVFYKRIQVQSAVKDLSMQILKFRQWVNYYIYFNLGALVLTFPVFFSGVLAGAKKEWTGTPQEFSQVYWVLLAVSIGSLLLILGLFFLYYYLVYGTFLRRLKSNLQQLKDIE